MERTRAPGSLDGRYLDEDRNLGRQGTAIIAADRNAIQEELIHLIEGSGLLPSGASDSQVYESVVKLISDALMKNGIDTLSPAEVDQLKNIDANALSTLVWGYLAGINQELGTGDSPTFSGLRVNRDNVDHAAHPTGGMRDIAATAITGAIRIQINGPSVRRKLTGWIDVYNGNDKQSFSVFFGGYTSTTEQRWRDTNLQIVGRSGRILVLFCREQNGNFSIRLGDTDSTWARPRIVVRNLSSSHSEGGDLNWEDALSIDVTTEAPAAINTSPGLAAYSGDGIVEQGSNGNGTYIRFGDGTQICVGFDQGPSTHSGVNIFGTGSGTSRYRYVAKTFPSNFTSIYYVAAAAEYASTASGVLAYVNTATNNNLHLAHGYRAWAGTFRARYFVIGRWK